ncbi:TetR/AcrR family transcriptional regulator [Actinomyces qiguomingii]|uniref:TetR/AcrR family transcriptional regulator n=2 Tax=Actinomyces qiguomingii TaxID=2057800 RepID=UPI001FD0DD37|nr:TetR/AcrR family transcriptional regulator [Actinomyces qiguomingii]
MPKETFLNLPRDKRARVMEALKTEFAAHSYAQTSVDRITAAAGISKGSFYQYFEDKRDAYLHLVRELMSARIGVGDAPVPEAPFEDVLRSMVLGSRDFYRRDPRAWEVLARSLSDDAPAALGSDENIDAGVHKWAAAAIAAGQDGGELRGDVDPETAAWMLEKVLLSVPEYVATRFEVSPQQAATDGSAFERPEIAAVADDIVAMLVAALMPQPQNRTGGRAHG